MHIFMGATEVCGNLKNMQMAFNAIGASTYSSVMKDPFFPHYSYDETMEHQGEMFGGLIDPKKPFRYFYYCVKRVIKIILCFDLVFFNWRTSFLVFNLDWLLFKLSGIKVFVMHCGGDVRFRPIQNQITPLQTLSEETELSTQACFIQALISQKTGEWFSHYLLTGIGHATFLSKPVYHFHVPIPQNIEKSKRPNEVISFIHAPSNREVKDTATVILAVKALQAEGYIFNFTLLENKPQNEVLDNLIKADVLIDQPNISLGTLSKEALASGCFLIAGNHTIWKNRIPNLPFERDNVALLKQGMIRCIEDKKWLQTQMDASYEAYKKHLGNESFICYIDGLLNHTVKKSVEPVQNHKALSLEHERNKLEKLLIKVCV